MVAEPTTFGGPVRMNDTVTISKGWGNVSPNIPRSSLLQDDLAVYTIPMTEFRVWDAFETNLPGTSATDDLALIGGTFATASPTIQTSDLKTAGATTRYARALLRIPAEYVDAETVTLRFHAGMKTTISDGTATLDVQAFKVDEEEGISADLVATGATTINSLTMADKNFSITATALTAGDLLDVRIAVAVNDTATGNAVIAIIGSVKLLCDVKG